MKIIKRNIVKSFLSCITIILFSCNILAAETGNLTVNVHIEARDDCTLNVNGHINFGTMEALVVTDSTDSSTLIVNCQNNLQYTIKLDGGLNPDNSWQNGGWRRAKNDTSDDMFAYQLYNDSSHSHPSGVWSELNPLNATGTGENQTHIIYAKNSGSATPASEYKAGNYSDIVSVTLEF